MKRTAIYRSSLKFVLFVLAIWILGSSTRPTSASDRVSQPGLYQGYSEPIYTEWVRSSQYVTVRDGTRLAVDIFRPSKQGKAVETPLPVIWTHHRYHRASLIENQPWVETIKTPWIQTLLKHGYIIATVDSRGSGASYGTRTGEFTPEETRDAYDLTEWFAAQPWCNQQVGMYGRSYLGITQYLAAGTAPPHLKALFPEMAMFDTYQYLYAGGIFREPFTKAWSKLTYIQDTSPTALQVDEDTDRQMLIAALKEHQANRDIFKASAQAPFADSIDAQTGRPLYSEWNPASALGAIKSSAIPIYHLSGWYDVWTKDAFLWLNNLNNPQKIVIGPWEHTGSAGFDLAAEHLRWYDYWLKGIDNGIMREPPIHYYTVGAPRGKEWRSAWQWPLPNTIQTPYYFAKGPSGSIASVNDGLLSTQLATNSDGHDEYLIDYATSSGITSRWNNGFGEVFGYTNLNSNDQKGLTYTTPPLSTEVEVTGHPIMHIFVTATDPDADFFAYLEEVDANNYATYVTEGSLRLSYRKLGEAPYNVFGLPYHRGYQQDLLGLPSAPTELTFDLAPISRVFHKGNRIRVTITGADKHNAKAVEQPFPVKLRIYRDTQHASYISLPLITPTAATPGQTLEAGARLWVPGSIIGALLLAGAYIYYRRRAIGFKPMW